MAEFLKWTDLGHTPQAHMVVWKSNCKLQCKQWNTDPADNAQGDDLASASANGLNPQTQNQIKMICIDWQPKSMSDLLAVASHFRAYQDHKEESTESKLMAFQVAKYDAKQRGRGGERQGIERGF